MNNSAMNISAYVCVGTYIYINSPAYTPRNKIDESYGVLELIFFLCGGLNPGPQEC